MIFAQVDKFDNKCNRIWKGKKRVTNTVGTAGGRGGFLFGDSFNAVSKVFDC